MVESTYAQRLGSLIGDEEGHVMSIRAFAERMKALDPRPPGSTRAMIHRYLKGDGPEPAPEFTRAASQLLGIRPAWLAFGDGEVTWERQHTKLLGDQRGPYTPEEKSAVDTLLAVWHAVEELGVSAMAEEVFYHYCFLLFEQKPDTPRDAESLAAILRQRFPRTIATSIYVDGPSGNVTLFGEATAATATDFLAQPEPWTPAETLEALRIPPPHPKKKGGR